MRLDDGIILEIEGILPAAVFRDIIFINTIPFVYKKYDYYHKSSMYFLFLSTCLYLFQETSTCVENKGYKLWKKQIENNEINRKCIHW